MAISPPYRQASHLSKRLRRSLRGNPGISIKAKVTAQPCARIKYSPSPSRKRRMLRCSPAGDCNDKAKSPMQPGRLLLVPRLKAMLQDSRLIKRHCPHCRVDLAPGNQKTFTGILVDLFSRLHFLQRSNVLGKKNISWYTSSYRFLRETRLRHPNSPIHHDGSGTSPSPTGRLIGFLMCFNEATAPAASVFPSMMDASISFVPALVNTEPLPA